MTGGVSSLFKGNVKNGTSSRLTGGENDLFLSKYFVFRTRALGWLIANEGVWLFPCPLMIQSLCDHQVVQRKSRTWMMLLGLLEISAARRSASSICSQRRRVQRRLVEVFVYSTRRGWTRLR